MPAGHIKAFGEASSPEAGAFDGKAMTIADLAERITFLDRGRGRVVRKLHEMLARVRDDRLHTSLADLVESHEPTLPSQTMSTAGPGRCLRHH